MRGSSNLTQLHFTLQPHYSLRDLDTTATLQPEGPGHHRLRDLDYSLRDLELKGSIILIRATARLQSQLS